MASSLGHASQSKVAYVGKPSPLGAVSKGESFDGVGAGLSNLGNSCFMNAVLQCLAHTPPLASYCRRKMHSERCKQQASFCSAYELERLVNLLFTYRAGPITPRKFGDNLPLIAKGFKIGRQEDAHEFLRYLLEHLTKSFNPSVNQPKDTKARHTVVQDWFQGARSLALIPMRSPRRHRLQRLLRSRCSARPYASTLTTHHPCAPQVSSRVRSAAAAAATSPTQSIHFWTSLSSCMPMESPCVAPSPTRCAASQRYAPRPDPPSDKPRPPTPTCVTLCVHSPSSSTVRTDIAARRASANAARRSSFA